jgi:hypothetical protein
MPFAAGKDILEVRIRHADILRRVKAVASEIS